MCGRLGAGNGGLRREDECARAKQRMDVEKREVDVWGGPGICRICIWGIDKKSPLIALLQASKCCFFHARKQAVVEWERPSFPVCPSALEPGLWTPRGRRHCRMQIADDFCHWPAGLREIAWAVMQDPGSEEIFVHCWLWRRPGGANGEEKGRRD